MVLDLENLDKDWSNRGQMTRIVLSILRQASEPLTTRDIALELLIERAPYPSSTVRFANRLISNGD
jgi:hypothetical protein